MCCECRAAHHNAAKMVLQNIKLYRLQRLNTFQRLNALSIQDPIPEHKER